MDYARLFSAAAIWGASFLAIEFALPDFSPFAIASYRIILAALLLMCICLYRSQVPALSRHQILFIAAIGVLNTVVPFILIAWGQLSIDSATTGILLASSPFVTLVLSHFMTRDDRFSWNKFFGLILGFLGVAALLGNGLQQGGGTFTGMLAVVLAGCCYGLSSILIRRLGSIASVPLAAGMLLSSALLMLPLLLWLDPPWQQQYRFSSFMAKVFLIIGPTAIGYVLRAQIVKNNGAVFMSNVGYLIPMFAVLWGWMFLNHQPTGIMLIALVLILLGIAIGQNRMAAFTRPSSM